MVTSEIPTFESEKSPLMAMTLFAPAGSPVIVSGANVINPEALIPAPPREKDTISSAWARAPNPSAMTMAPATKSLFFIATPVGQPRHSFIHPVLASVQTKYLEKCGNCSPMSTKSE
jgi:hypothetical protein